MQITFYGPKATPEVADLVPNIVEHIGDHFQATLKKREAETIPFSEGYILFNEDLTALLWGTKEAMTIQFIEPITSDFWVH